MSDQARFDERLRTAFLDGDAATSDGCADAEAIWRAARGEAESAEVERLLDHAASCPRCAEAWRLAKLLAPEPAAVPARSSRVPVLLALAAVLVIAAVLVLPTRPWQQTAEDAWRGDIESIGTEIADMAIVPRDAVVLTWTPGAEQARYTLTMSTSDGAFGSTIDGLEEPRYEIPREDLAAVAPDAVLYWRVTATLPDGSERASPTFRVVVK